MAMPRRKLRRPAASRFLPKPPIIDKTKIEFLIIKEQGAYTAFAPALDLTTCGNSIADAQRMAREVLDIFFDELAAMGTTQQVLEELGWTTVERRGELHWQPPQLVGRSIQAISVPAPI